MEDEQLLMVEERVQGIDRIHRSVGQLNEAFRDIHVLVNDQEALLDGIEMNVISTVVHMSSAKQELTSAEGDQKKHNNKCCIILVALLVVIVLILFSLIIFKTM